MIKLTAQSWVGDYGREVSMEIDRDMVTNVEVAGFFKSLWEALEAEGLRPIKRGKQ